MPALPLDDAGVYVAAAYTVFLVLLAIYVGIMAAKLGRISREIGELVDHVERRQAGVDGTAAERDPAAPDRGSRGGAARDDSPVEAPSRDRPGQPADGPERPRQPIQEER